MLNARKTIRREISKGFGEIRRRPFSSECLSDIHVCECVGELYAVLCAVNKETLRHDNRF